MTGPDVPAWRKLTDEELRALTPFSVNCEGLSDDAVRRVEVEYRKMIGRAVSRFLHHLDRVPDQREGELLARAVVQYLNAVVVPILGGHGGAHATLQ
jgi:hypothetical protein